MHSEEKRLKYFLNYVPNRENVFIREDAVLWFRQSFLDFWQSIDQKENSNYISVINALYLSNDEKSFKDISKSVCLHVRSIARYRIKFIAKMKELIEEYKEFFWV